MLRSSESCAAFLCVVLEAKKNVGKEKEREAEANTYVYILNIIDSK